MNDIAIASGFGRRTLYTYFDSKEEIFMSVVQSELERLSDKLMGVAAKDTTPDQKIIELIYTHLNSVKETVYRNGNLRAEFFRDIWGVESVRKSFDRKEIMAFRKVMEEGNKLGVFDIENVDLTADIAHYCVKGLEVPYIFGRIGRGLTEETAAPLVARFIRKALGKK
jgi:AcrR family transcriptional regulator